MKEKIESLFVMFVFVLGPTLLVTGGIIIALLFLYDDGSGTKLKTSDVTKKVESTGDKITGTISDKKNND